MKRFAVRSNQSVRNSSTLRCKASAGRLSNSNGLAAQRLDRIDAGGAPGGEEAAGQRNEREDDEGEAECGRGVIFSDSPRITLVTKCSRGDSNVSRCRNHDPNDRREGGVPASA